MLFAHGFGCDQNMWRFVTPAFENDFRIVLFDYVGSGKSDLTAYDADRYATLDGGARWHRVSVEEIRKNEGLAREIPAGWGPGFLTLARLRRAQ